MRLETALLSLLLTGMVLLAGTQIVLRNLFDSGWVWADPLLRISVLWLGLLGALAATRTNHHIKIDVINRFLPEKLQRGVFTLNMLFSATVCALIAWHGARFVWQEYQEAIQAFAGLPAWWFECIIPIGFGLMSLRFLMVAILGLPRSVVRSGDDA